MSGSFDLVINGKTVKANYGETLVDAGLSGWVAIPHDCCSGQCETCRVSVLSGQVDDRGTAEKGTVLACQAKVIANAVIACRCAGPSAAHIFATETARWC